MGRTVIYGDANVIIRLLEGDSSTRSPLETRLASVGKFENNLFHRWLNKKGADCGVFRGEAMPTKKVPLLEWSEVRAALAHDSGCFATSGSQGHKRSYCWNRTTHRCILRFGRFVSSPRTGSQETQPELRGQHWGLANLDRLEFSRRLFSSIRLSLGALGQMVSRTPRRF